MQRISASMEKEIANQQSFRLYTNPALNCRIANDLQRSQQSVRVKKDNDDSVKSINVGDFGPTPLIPSTQSLSLLQQPPTPKTTQQSSLLTIASTHPSSVDATNIQMAQVVTPHVVRVDDTEKYRILVVDDSPLNRKMLSKLLKSKGYNIEEAADGQIAVDKIKQEADAGRSYDVILMDFVMPVMDGPTATRAIRAMHILTPIFGLTGRLDKFRHVSRQNFPFIICKHHLWTSSEKLF